MLTITLLLALLQPPAYTTGYSAVHLESGRRVSSRGAEAFPMGSVYKFPIAITVLRRVDAGTLRMDRPVHITEFSPGHSPLREEAKGRPVTRTVRQLVGLMLRDSDNTACDVLLDLIGGGDAVTRDLGIKGIRIDRQERVIARDIAKHGEAHYSKDVRDTSTPDAMVELLTRFWNRRLGLSQPMHALAVKLMTETKTGAKRIRAELPAGASLAHKTGTMPGVVNDVGVITLADGTHIALAVFTKGGGEEQAIAKVAREVLAKLAR
jgi:beta-lactamase class A